MMSDGKFIHYEGHEYHDDAQSRAMIAVARRIKDSLPQPSEGHTRLWQGNRPGEVGSNPSFTNSLAGIALPFMRTYNGLLSYVDVPTRRLNSYLLTQGTAEGAEFLIPPELASTAKVAAKLVDNRVVVDTEAKDAPPIPRSVWDRPIKVICNRPPRIRKNGSREIEIML